jgi:hypothetical protein
LKSITTKSSRQVTTLILRGTDHCSSGFLGGCPDLPGLVEANQGLVFDPAKVSAPALIVVASGEYKSPEIARQNTLCRIGQDEQAQVAGASAKASRSQRLSGPKWMQDISH